MIIPSSRVVSSPTKANRLTVSFALIPASTSTRVSPATISTALPVDPLPRTVNFIYESVLTKQLLTQDEFGNFVVTNYQKITCKIKCHSLRPERSLERFKIAAIGSEDTYASC